MSTVDRYSLKYKRKRIGVSTDTDCKVEENVTKKSNVSIRNRVRKSQRIAQKISFSKFKNTSSTPIMLDFDDSTSKANFKSNTSNIKDSSHIMKGKSLIDDHDSDFLVLVNHIQKTKYVLPNLHILQWLTKKTLLSLEKHMAGSDISKWFIKKRKDKSCDTKENNQKDQGVVHEAENTMDVGHAKAGENVLEIVPYMGEEATNVEENVIGVDSDEEMCNDIIYSENQLYEVSASGNHFIVPVISQYDKPPELTDIDANEDHELQHEASEMESEETISEHYEEHIADVQSEEHIADVQSEHIDKGLTSEKENEHQDKRNAIQYKEVEKITTNEPQDEGLSVKNKEIISEVHINMVFFIVVFYISITGCNI
ncbi:hypothetical protein R6Q59_015688 [Mikania micrantha]